MKSNDWFRRNLHGYHENVAPFLLKEGPIVQDPSQSLGRGGVQQSETAGPY